MGFCNEVVGFYGFLYGAPDAAREPKEECLNGPYIFCEGASIVDILGSFCVRLTQSASIGLKKPSFTKFVPSESYV